MPRARDLLPLCLAAIAATSCSTSGSPGGPDAMVQGARALPGCNPDGGIECDGDWSGRCDPACGPGQCCSPRGGAFACVPMESDGRCPAADLMVDPARIAGHYRVEWVQFAPDSCALVEQCVDAPGWRRLLRFDTWTPNAGTADLYLGRPSPDSPYFEYSPCHQHYHFTTYATYELRAAGAVLAAGHKQAFCLEDYFRYPWDGTQRAMEGGRYDCFNAQGISAGWQDVYSTAQPCQWVDVTAVAPGDYTLHIALNTRHLLAERDYTNNEADVPVTLPLDDSAADPTRPCAAPTPGLDRQCGWTREGAHACAPGEPVSVGCAATCMLGSCEGDTVLRVYEGDRSGAAGNYDIRAVIASNDDAACGGAACEDGGECCSLARFTCPAGGRYTVLWAPYRSDRAASCSVATSP